MNIHEFYEADPRRRDSEEEEFGDGWTERSDEHSTYRLHWVVDTGEAYTVREPHPGGLFARYLDQLNLDQPDVGELTVEVYGVYGRDELERAIEGWEKVMEEPNSLDWIRTHLGSPPAHG